MSGESGKGMIWCGIVVLVVAGLWTVESRPEPIKGKDEPCYADFKVCKMDGDCCSLMCMFKKGQEDKICWDRKYLAPVEKRKPPTGPRKCLLMDQACNNHDECCTRGCRQFKTKRTCVQTYGSTSYDNGKDYFD